MKKLYKTMTLVGTNNHGREHTLNQEDDGEKSPRQAPIYSLR